MKDEKTTNKKSVKVEETTEDVVVQNAPEVKSDIDKTEKGIVVDCQLLNVRQKPSADGAIVSVIPTGTKVKIEKTKSNDLYYNISTKEGITGFCMKKFIKVY